MHSLQMFLQGDLPYWLRKLVMQVNLFDCASGSYVAFILCAVCNLCVRELEIIEELSEMTNSTKNYFLNTTFHKVL